MGNEGEKKWKLWCPEEFGHLATVISHKGHENKELIFEPKIYFSSHCFAVFLRLDGPNWLLWQLLFVSVKERREEWLLSKRVPSKGNVKWLER